MVDVAHAMREIRSLLEGVTNNLGFIGSPKREKVEALIGQIQKILESGPDGAGEEEGNPVEVARTMWVIEDIRAAIADRYGLEVTELDVSPEILRELGVEMHRVLEDDCTERGWDSIGTQLDILEEEGNFPVLQRLRRQKEEKDGKFDAEFTKEHGWNEEVIDDNLKKFLQKQRIRDVDLELKKKGAGEGK